MHFRDLCAAVNVKPVNGMKYRWMVFENDFTFIRSNGKSQINYFPDDFKWQKEN